MTKATSKVSLVIYLEEKNADEPKKEEEDDTQLNTHMIPMSFGKVKKVKEEEDDTQPNSQMIPMSAGKAKKVKE